MLYGRRRIRFVKMSAGGNDFVVLDNREKRLPRDFSALAQKLCKRKFGIGADGLLVLENSNQCNFRMKYFNADGSRASLCGNGARCIAFFANRGGAAPADMKFNTDAGVYRATVHEKNVLLFMRPPHSIRINVSLRVQGKKIVYNFADTGVPHVVLFVKNIHTAPLEVLGKKIRFHKAFKPAGTNVNFVKKKNSHALWIRTYERGVEDETSACGTGVTASVLIGGLTGLVKSPVRCITHSGGILTVHYDVSAGGKHAGFENICLEGTVEVTFEGEVYI